MAIRILLLTVLLGACAAEERSSAADAAASADTALPPPGPAQRDTAPTIQAFTDSLLAVDDVSLEGLRQAFGEPRRVEREPTPNRHVPEQTDTILRISYPGALFRLYQVSGGRAMLEHVEVTEPRFLRWPVPTIGTPADSVVAWWGEPLRREQTTLVYEDGGPVSMPLFLHTQGGRVSSIERAYYVD